MRTCKRTFIVLSRRIIIVAGVVLLLGLGPQTIRGQQPTAAALVEQFFPQRLVAESADDLARGGPSPFRASNFVDADLNGTGTADYIVAAYSNGFSGAVRVLQRRGVSAILVSEPSSPLMMGIFPTLMLIDLDGDRRPEVVVSFSSARGPSADWIFKWNGTDLTSIGPTISESAGSISTLLSEADFVDLNGDGVLEIVVPPALPPPGQQLLGTYTVFALLSGIYRASGDTLNFLETFVRSTGRPVVTTRTFNVAEPNVPYILRILNGDTSGDRASSANIVLNGMLVVGPSQFNQAKSQIIVPIRLNNSNTLSVELRSAPSSKITVIVQPQM